MSESFCTINYLYKLVDPRCPNITRYIGRSCNPEKRYYHHISNSQKLETHKHHWIQKLLKSNIQPKLITFKSGSPKNIKNWENIEIRRESKINPKLTNSLSTPNKKSKKREGRNTYGVCFVRGKWNVEITVNYKTEYLGRFKSKDAARRHYDSVARYYFGSNAKTNFEGISRYSIERAKQISAKFNCRKKKKIKRDKTKSYQNKYSSYYGVSFNKKENRFVVNIKIPEFGKYKYLSSFKTEEEARLWYDRVAGYYKLPTNKIPDKLLSLSKAKQEIRKNR